MKKYILLLLSASCFGQFNPVQWYEFGNGGFEPNTYIGGVGSGITTGAGLASILGISQYRIKSFYNDGTNIKCHVIGNYTIGNSLVSSYRLVLKYYYDLDGLMTIGNQGFYSSNVQKVVSPNSPSIATGAFDQNVSFGQSKNELRRLYIPNTTTIGNTVGNDLVFRSGNLGGGTVYANPFLATSNAGGVEGDLAYLSGGNTIVYVTDFTPPNQITDLSSGTITSTSIQVNFTTPTGSANAIDFYEVWVNGFPYQEISGSGGIITGLTTGTSYEIEVKPVDVFYNKSISNKINVSTL